MSWAERTSGQLSPRALRIFLAVAETRNMAKAADGLAMSRPLVSRAIAALEHRVGQRLFDRTARGVRLTGAGEVLREHAFAVFDALRQAGLALEALSDPGSGELRLGASEPFAAGIVGAAIGALHTRHFGLRVELDSVSPEEMPVYLRERRGELVVMRVTDTPVPDDIASQAVLHEPLVVVAGRQNRLKRRRRLAPGDLLDAPWILSWREAHGGSPFMQALGALGHAAPRRLIVTNSVNLRLHLVSGGDYLTLVPGSALAYGPLSRMMLPVPVALPRMEWTTAVLWLRDRSMSAAGLAFVAMLEDLAGRMRVEGGAGSV